MLHHYELVSIDLGRFLWEELTREYCFYITDGIISNVGRETNAQLTLECE